ncbi:hypothetical protein FACS189485_16350 [Spirochaetia bacterium]|nr:hypothetical protein FACS189485_16350 [Spirochaetia bacterium]
MKKNSILGMFVMVLVLGFIFIGCNTGNGDDNGNDGYLFVIGETGPAGGTVFYDKGSYSDGWRYMEATPDVPEFYKLGDDDYYNCFFSTNWFPPNSYPIPGTNSIDGTSTAIGSGKRNTEIIVAYFDSMGKSGNYAASICANLNYGSKDDWFLPSKDELNQMYLNLKGYHDVRNNMFWSSSQADSSTAWLQNLDEDTQTTDDGPVSTGSPFPQRKGRENSVRAIRRF